MPMDIHLKQRLEMVDEQYGGDEMYRIFGPTMLSWSVTDSSRMYMFTSHLKQTLTLLEPDVPRLQTGFENAVGKYNRAYKQLKGIWEVKAIIQKFTFPDQDMDDPNTRAKQIFTLVLYCPDTNTYEMIEKPIAENLTEKFGYVYNTEFMDSLHVGDVLRDPILYKSTSYDKHMNYRFGKNARVFYSTSTDTIEDAIVIRRGWAEHVKSVEIDQVQIPLNDNDVMLNMYGNSSTYQGFPEVGEYVNDSLICATRRINKSHMLYDFLDPQMQEVMDTDSDYYTSKHSSVYDINVYYNGDEPFPDNKFNQQLHHYYQDGCRYAQEVLDWCNAIKQSGASYTPNVSHYRSRYLHWNDPEYKWKNKDKVFNHAVLEFRVKSVVDLNLGGKLSGRWGNKGVISRIMDDQLKDAVVDMVDDGTLTADDKRLLRTKISIVDDERMPYYIRKGQKIYVDVMYNASGAIRRLNPGQLVEVETNFIAEQVQQLVIDAETEDEKADIIFKFLKLCSESEHAFFKVMYDGYDELVDVDGWTIHMKSPASKTAFIKNVEKNGFYIIRPPHKPLLYDDVIRMYEEFPMIRPVDIYVDIFGTKERKTLRPGVIGYQYMLVLKQNSNKNFSARSTFRVNRSNLPAKDVAKKTNRSSYARTPVKLSEIYNLLCAVSSRDLAEYNIFMRSSALGRKSLDRILYAKGNPLKIQKLVVRDNFTNANADILAARMKGIGLRIRMFSNPEGYLTMYNTRAIIPLYVGDYVFYDKPDRKEMYVQLMNRFHKLMASMVVVENYRGQKHDVCWDRVFDDPFIKENYDLTDDFKDMIKNTTKGAAERIRQKIAAPQKRTTTLNATAMISAPSAPVKKKRGRKSNAEKLAEELLRKEEEAARAREQQRIEYDEDESEDEDEELHASVFLDDENEDELEPLSLDVEASDETEESYDSEDE